MVFVMRVKNNKLTMLNSKVAFKTNVRFVIIFPQVGMVTLRENIRRPAMKKRLKRQEIPIEKTWKTEDLYMSKEAFLMALEDAKKKARLLLEYKGCLLESPQTLLEAIEKMESLYVELNLLDTYTELNQAVDATDTENQELSMVFGAASTQIQTTVAFFENELMAISDDQYTNFFKEEPKLEEYRTYIEDLYKKRNINYQMRQKKLWLLLAK